MKTNYRFRFLPFALALALLFTVIASPHAFAAETLNQNATPNDEIVEFVEVTPDSEHYEQALASLELTKDEADDITLYVASGITLDSDTATCDIVINPGLVHSFPTFTFYSDTNVGSYWTCNGNKLTFSYYAEFDNEQGYLDLRLWRADETNIPTYWINGIEHNKGGITELFDVKKGAQYHFVYHKYVAHSATVSIVVGVQE